MNRLETDWFKLVADEDVRPLILTAQPAPGENLIGFVSRVMEKQAFSSLAAGLSLAGIGCTKPSNIASLLRNADQIQNLATLLDCPVSQIQQLLEPVVTTEGSRTRMTHYCGMAIQSRYRTFERRVSPRGLAADRVHLARWSLRPFNFDPVTRERLLTTCPVCKLPLGWRRSLGITKCDKCRHPDGTPATDLRDFPQATIGCDDDEAMQFLSDIVHHDPAARQTAVSNLRTPWIDLTPSEVFETLVALAWAKASLHDPNPQSCRPTKDHHFLSIEPDQLAEASRVMLGGETGLQEYVADAFAKISMEGGTIGAKASFGRVGYLGSDKYLGLSVRETIEAALLATRAEHGIPVRGGRAMTSRAVAASHEGERTGVDPSNVLAPGYMRVGLAAHSFGLSEEIFNDILQQPRMAAFIQNGRTRKIGVDRQGLIETFPETFDSVGPAEIASILKIPASGAQTLSRAGILLESITVKRGTQTHRRYSRRSLTEFVGTLAKLSSASGNSDTTLRQAMTAVRWPYGNSAIALVYIFLFPSNLTGLGSHHLDWRDAICLAEVDHFKNELPRLAERFGAGGVYITKSGVMNRLRCSNATFGSLVHCNLLRPAKSPLKHQRFLVSDVEAFCRKYVLSEEAASTFGFKGPKQAFFMASRLGMRPKFAWGSNMPLVFDRTDFERVRSALK